MHRAMQLAESIERNPRMAKDICFVFGMMISQATIQKELLGAALLYGIRLLRQELGS